ncbi:chromate efflux transporter [Marinomonas piezotolerans]|nr:chromate efflux transporter [Marinomonas piezotolerans]
MMVFNIFKTFFLLGCTSFGGPAAHLGYFRKLFVEQLKWVDEPQYAQWIAISQVMPGPGSSQVGFAIGCHRAGIMGGLAAFVGFTLPSVMLMCAFAWFGTLVVGEQWFTNIISALKLMAVVIVADAALGMYRSFCSSRTLKLMALAGVLFTLAWPFGFAGLWLVAIAGLLGAGMRSKETPSMKDHRRPSLVRANVALVIFVVLFVVSLMLPDQGVAGLAAQFYQSGSLVFGGGHVVLPLISEFVSNDVSTSQVLTGYAAAQAVPGPMFTIATYLGAMVAPAEHSIIWALVATGAIFAPGLLLMLVGQAYWQRLAGYARAQGAVQYINAAVVGLLVATLVFPIIPTSVTTYWQIVVVGAAFVWVHGFKPPIWQVVVAFLAGAMTASLL